MKYSEVVALTAELDRTANSITASLPVGEELFWGDGRPPRLTWRCGWLPPGATRAYSIEAYVLLDGPWSLDSAPLAILRRYMEIREQIEQWKKNEAAWPQARPACGQVDPLLGPCVLVTGHDHSCIRVRC